MKKLILLLLVIPLLGFGQKETDKRVVKVLRNVNYFSQDLRDNYIEKIHKINQTSIINGQSYVRVAWYDEKEKEYSQSLGLRDNLSLQFPIPYFLNYPSDRYMDYQIKMKNSFYESDEHYNYFKYTFFYSNDLKKSLKDGYNSSEDFGKIRYGTRLLIPGKTNSWRNINSLFYRKEVNIRNSKTVINNYYFIAAKIDDYYRVFTQTDMDLKQYFSKEYRDLNSGERKLSFDDPTANSYNRSLVSQIHPNIWINVDDNIQLCNYCPQNISPNVYEKKHIITLNDNFDFQIDIENGMYFEINDQIPIHHKGHKVYEPRTGHTYEFIFGLNDPSEKIEDLKVKNAIKYKFSYVNNFEYNIEIKKKIEGIYYSQIKRSGLPLEGTKTVSQMYTENVENGFKNGGLIKFFRRGNVFYASINNNLVDKTPDHNFENNTILFKSYWHHAKNQFRSFSPRKQWNNLSEGNPIKISKTINEVIIPNEITIKPTFDNGNWSGNGSGFFISKDGYIATNYHVIEDANEIEVEYINNQKKYKYKAEIIQKDPSNDLAILKIKNPSFKDLALIPYNLKTRSSDVGSSVFSLGFPMALSGMGKEIKFTDGKISSKTGFNGDIRTYQTTTPIQAGNSGGPLFDYNGNLVGINSAKISSSKADNVSYSIKASYLNNLMDVLPESISIPSNTYLSTKSLTDQIKVLSNYVVLIKVK